MRRTGPQPGDGDSPVTPRFRLTARNDTIIADIHVLATDQDGRPRSARTNVLSSRTYSACLLKTAGLPPRSTSSA